MRTLVPIKSIKFASWGCDLKQQQQLQRHCAVTVNSCSNKGQRLRQPRGSKLDSDEFPKLPHDLEWAWLRLGNKSLSWRPWAVTLGPGTALPALAGFWRWQLLSPEGQPQWCSANPKCINNQAAFPRHSSAWTKHIDDAAVTHLQSWVQVTLTFMAVYLSSNNDNIKLMDNFVTTTSRHRVVNVSTGRGSAVPARTLTQDYPTWRGDLYCTQFCSMLQWKIH